MDLIDGLRAFVATARSGSFTQAADLLGISNRLASKYVAALEERLGTRLLQRTTRRVGLTPAGEELLSRAPELLDQVDDMLALAAQGGRGLTGMLRVSAPVDFGTLHVKTLLARFATLHPELSVDLRLDDRYVDLASEGIDLAFRIGAPGQRSLKARKLGQIGARVVAAPAYLAAHPAPLRPADLAGHSCIVDTNRRNPTRWRFYNDDGGETEVAVEGRFMVNSARVARDFALAGLGLAYCPGFVLGETLSSGALVQVLGAFPGPAAPLNAVYLEGRALPRKVRALIDFAVTEFRGADLG